MNVPLAPGTTFDAALGYLDGTWRAYIKPDCIDAFAEHITTLSVSHDAGISAATGTYLWLAAGETGDIGGNFYNVSNDTWSVSLLIDDDGSSASVGFSCQVVGQNLMSCTHSSTITGTVVDAVLRRQ